jgi:Fe2+ transport system protein FeoA
MTLGEAREGRKFLIMHTADSAIEMQTTRFGIGKGSLVAIEKNIPGGPVIISRNQMELAIGRDIASQIMVEEIH